MKPKKYEYPKITFRPTPKGRVRFINKCLRMKIKDGYTTQDKVLNELITQFIRGDIKVPWEER